MCSQEIVAATSSKRVSLELMKKDFGPTEEARKFCKEA
jgi:hypothetical protein